MEALLRAWEGDPVSAFGGVLVFTDPWKRTRQVWLAERFVELVRRSGAREEARPHWEFFFRSGEISRPFRFGDSAGFRARRCVRSRGKIFQGSDTGLSEDAQIRDEECFSRRKNGAFEIRDRRLPGAQIQCDRAGSRDPGSSRGFQLVGAGQGQPNRIEALKALAVPRAQSVLKNRAARSAIASW